MIWNNYRKAGQLPADRVETMWRTLDRIAEACESKHPAELNFMSKEAIREAAEAALPNDNDQPRDLDEKETTK